MDQLLNLDDQGGHGDEASASNQQLMNGDDQLINTDQHHINSDTMNNDPFGAFDMNVGFDSMFYCSSLLLR